METEIVDKFFLELSQVTKAKTYRELSLESTLKTVLNAWDNDGVSEKNARLYMTTYHWITGGVV